MTDPVYITGQQAADCTLFSSAQACHTVSSLGARLSNDSVPDQFPEIDELFKEIIHLWKDCFDTYDIAEATGVTEAEAYRLIYYYLAAKYVKGWGSKL